MPTLHIQNRLLSQEKFTLSIDGQPCTGDTFTVPPTFRLRVQQVRLSASPRDTVGALFSLLSVLALGGRAGWGSEAASPYYAVWEGTCHMSRDGEIELWLQEDGFQISFILWSDTVTFQDVTTHTGGRDPAHLRRWALIDLPPALFVSGVCLFLFFAVGLFGIDPSPDPALWLVKLIFLLLPLCLLFQLWKSLLRPFRKRRADPLTRLSRRLTLQRLMVALLAAAAVFEGLSFWVFSFPPAALTPFPAAALLLVHLSAVNDTLERAMSTGVRTRETEALLRQSRALRAAACSLFALLLLLLLLALATGKAA